jgi:hypothetical protein
MKVQEICASGPASSRQIEARNLENVIPTSHTSRRSFQQLSENAFRERELAFRCDSFVLFGDALDAVARIVGISVRRRNEMANFIGTKDC